MKSIFAGKKKILIILGLLLVLAGVFKIWWDNRPYEVGKDEIALYIQLDVDEDIGLLVFDYSFDGKKRGGGISNADRSLIRHDDTLIQVWDREMPGMENASDSMELSIRFRIITEYVDPNFENIYPEEITSWLDELSWQVEFGKAYYLTITGNKTDGYRVTREVSE